MKILLLEPFFTGSHRKWAEEYRQFSRHEIEILSLSGNHWKWRMHGAAITLAATAPKAKPDLILASDMLDLNLFLSLTKSWSAKIPSAIYFHENQLNYPWSPADVDTKLRRDNHYAFINYASALGANHVFFNSRYHREAFVSELPKFLKAFPDNNNLSTIESIGAKSSVLPLAMDLQKFNTHKPGTIEKPMRAVVLWNHRWEYDKNPEQFFNAMFEIAERGIDFKLIVLGENYDKKPPIFDIAREKLADKILHFGYAESFEDYCKLLWMADLMPVTSIQDFFGASVVEAMACNVVPFLPHRLAYPEHIPQQFHHTFFYDENEVQDGEFINKIQRRIWDVKYLRIMDMQQYAIQYDWSRQIKQYDDAMERVTL